MCNKSSVHVVYSNSYLIFYPNFKISRKSDTQIWSKFGSFGYFSVQIFEYPKTLIQGVPGQHEFDQHDPRFNTNGKSCYFAQIPRFNTISNLPDTWIFSNSISHNLFTFFAPKCQHLFLTGSQTFFVKPERKKLINLINS